MSVFLVASVLSFSFSTKSSVISVTTAIPAPYPIIDVWEYVVNDSYGYSNSFVKSPINIGSESSVTNIFGTFKVHDKKIIDGYFQVQKNLGTMFDYMHIGIIIDFKNNL